MYNFANILNMYDIQKLYWNLLCILSFVSLAETGEGEDGGFNVRVGEGVRLLNKTIFNYIFKGFREHIPDLKWVPNLEQVLDNKNALTI